MEDLQYFLSVPLSDGSAIFDTFAKLPGAVYCKGEEKLQRFLYVPGTRADRVVLIAHTDTVWDEAYRQKDLPSCFRVDPEQKRIVSDQEKAGIGADDRAGCALLWKLRNSGHSLLLLDGEEHGHHGAVYLRQHYPKLLKELNRHRYMMQFDLWGDHFCMYHQIPNSRKFCSYIESSLSLQALDKKSGTDVSWLCRQACGVNVSVGYENFHSPKEYLDIRAWQQMEAKLQAFLAKTQPSFRTSLKKRLLKKCRVMLSRFKRKCMAILGRKG